MTLFADDEIMGNCGYCGGVGVLLKLNPEGPAGRGLEGKHEELYLERTCPRCKGAKVLPRTGR